MLARPYAEPHIAHNPLIIKGLCRTPLGRRDDGDRLILPTMVEGPRRSAQQQIGQLAEQEFGAFVVRQGAIWHPTSLGNDIGIDGRVELVEDSYATAVEFGVQIKGAKRLTTSRRGHVLAGRVKSSTVLYWLARLSPTLVVAYDGSSGKLHAEWAHRIPGIVDLPRLDKPPVRLSLKLPDRELTDEVWAELTQQATAMHGTIAEAFASDPLRAVLSVVYVRLAGIYDVLIEWVYALAYPPDREIDVEDVTLVLPGLGPPRFQAAGGFMFPLHLAVGAVSLSDGLLKVLESRLDSSHPACKAAESFSGGLHELVDSMFVDEPRPVPEVTEVQLLWRQVDIEIAITNLGLVALQIRDFNREIRSFLFPEQMRFTGYDSFKGEQQLFKILRGLSEDLFTPLTELRRHE